MRVPKPTAADPTWRRLSGSRSVSPNPALAPHCASGAGMSRAARGQGASRDPRNHAAHLSQTGNHARRDAACIVPLASCIPPVATHAHVRAAPRVARRARRWRASTAGQDRHVPACARARPSLPPQRAAYAAASARASAAAALRARARQARRLMSGGRRGTLVLGLRLAAPTDTRSRSLRSTGSQSRQCAV